MSEEHSAYGQNKEMSVEYACLLRSQDHGLNQIFSETIEQHSIQYFGMALHNMTGTEPQYPWYQKTAPPNVVDKNMKYGRPKCDNSSSLLIAISGMFAE